MIRFLTVALFSTALCACATVIDINEVCQWHGDGRISAEDAGTLALLVAAPPERFRRKPFAVVYRPTQADQVAALRLDLIERPVPWPALLDESGCRDTDWRSYAISVDPGRWRAFWRESPPFGFELGVGFTDSLEPVALRRFGMALSDAETGAAIVSCGCYHELR